MTRGLALYIYVDWLTVLLTVLQETDWLTDSTHMTVGWLTVHYLRLLECENVELSPGRLEYWIEQEWAVTGGTDKNALFCHWQSWPRCTSLYCAVLNSIVLYQTALYSSALDWTVIHFIVLFNSTLHCTALHCTVIYCTALCTAERYNSLYHYTENCSALNCIANGCIKYKLASK